MRPLTGVRVVELAAGPAGITAGSLLAELGAEVVRPDYGPGDTIDRTGAAGQLLAAARRAGKSTVSVGGAGRSARADALALAASADVLIEPEADAALGAEACARNPALVSCAITPWGRSGPWADRPGSDLTVQALTGAIDVTGLQQLPPVRTGVALADDGAALFATIGILAALRWHHRTGAGQRLDVAASDCLTALMPGFLSNVLSGLPLGRQGNRHPSVSPWNAYPTLDGSVLVCTVSDEQWARLATMIGRPELIQRPECLTVPDRRANADFLDEVVTEWTRRHTTDEIVERCRAEGLPAGMVATIKDVVRDCAAVAPGSASLFEQDGRALPLVDLWLDGELEAGDPDPAAAQAAGESAPQTALDDITVVEMAQFTSGPFVTRILSWLGARVVKVEPAKGDEMRNWGPHVAGLSYFFLLNNAGKQAVELDVKSESGLAALLSLTDDADVFVSNFGPGVVERLGLGADVLRERNPRLIVNKVSGYEEASSLARDKAFDTVAQAQSGMMSVTGWADGDAVKSGLSASDVIAATVAALKIVAALVERDRTGRGRALQAPLLNASLWATRLWWPHVAVDSAPERSSRMGNRDPYWPGHGVYACTDGPLAVGVASTEQWAALLRILPLEADARAALDDPEQAWADHDRVARALQQMLEDHTCATATELLHAHGVPAAPVLSLTDAIEHPQIRDRGALVWVPQPGTGEVRLTACPITFSGFSPQVGGFVDRVEASAPEIPAS